MLLPFSSKKSYLSNAESTFHETFDRKKKDIMFL